MNTPDSDDDVASINLSTAEKLNLVTGKITWPELQRAFAQGKIIVVDSSLDLIKIASDFVEDSSLEVEQLVQTGQVRRAEKEDARKWNEAGMEFWAVVTAPWVVVQEIDPAPVDQSGPDSP